MTADSCGITNMRQAKTQPEPTEIDGFAIPQWWRCQWQRLGCGEDSCRLCGRINRDRRKHMARGEDPDSPEAALADVAGAFHETMTMLRQDAKRRGIDLSHVDEEELREPPEPDTFLLYRQVMRWRKKMSDIVAGVCRSDGDSWTKTEAAKDLGWYGNLLPVKVYRQLCSRWEREHDPAGYSEVDYQYTRYVIGQILVRLKKALARLTATAENPVLFMLLAAQLNELEYDLATL